MADQMKYRNLGLSGLKVSVLSFGNMTSGLGFLADIKDSYDVSIEKNLFALTEKCISKGVNLFDTAELYGEGLSETYLGNNLRQGRWDRDELIISSKLSPRMGGLQGNSQKRLISGIKASIKRLQTDFIDVVFLHRPDDEVPIKEQVKTMNKIVEKGYANYWGTSEFESSTLAEIFSICEKYGYEPPIADQCEYNMLERKKIEVDYTPLFDSYHYGAIAYSPLYGGMLSGKYNNGLSQIKTPSSSSNPLASQVKSTVKISPLHHSPTDSPSEIALSWCMANGYVPAMFNYNVCDMWKNVKDPKAVSKAIGQNVTSSSDQSGKLGRFEKFGWKLEKNENFLQGLGLLSQEIGCSQAQLALAWSLANKDVSTVLFGATSVDQIEDNLGALRFLDRFTPEFEARIENLLKNRPEPQTDFRTFEPKPYRR